MNPANYSPKASLPDGIEQNLKQNTIREFRMPDNLQSSFRISNDKDKNEKRLKSTLSKDHHFENSYLSYEKMNERD